jgi:hypothetical protein
MANRSIQKPLILYCSSVDPQLSVAGMLLVHRHFSRLESYQVALVAPASEITHGLSNVSEMVSVPKCSIWLSRMRRGWLFPFADWLIAKQIRKKCDLVTARIKPSVVVTVLMPDGYMTAAADYAKKNQIPLVLLCHDDYEDSSPNSFHGKLATIYRQAFIRLCVSAPMAIEYKRRYGVDGQVMYPIPSASASSPVQQLHSCSIKVGFIGTIMPGYEQAFLKLADNLNLIGGQIVIASSSSRRAFPKLWSHPAVLDFGQLAPDKVKGTFLEAGVNVLGVIQSFDPADERAFRFNFPSKLVEYGTFGLPLLIIAPETASAVTWAKSKGSVAAIATDLGAGLDEVVKQLSTPEARYSLAVEFFEASADFDPCHSQAIFEKALQLARDGCNTKD